MKMGSRNRLRDLVNHEQHEQHRAHSGRSHLPQERPVHGMLCSSFYIGYKASRLHIVDGSENMPHRPVQLWCRAQFRASGVYWPRLNRGLSHVS
jgi:hypothetical protein